MTALILPPTVRVYVNHSRWIAECPYGCGAALALTGRETTFHCTECQSILIIEWPDNADEIWEALMERKFPRFRNWFPKDHEMAIKCGLPHGQTPKELRDEAAENGG